MANLQCFVEGTAKSLSSSVEDASHTMAVVAAAYIASARGGLPPIFD